MSLFLNNSQEKVRMFKDLVASKLFINVFDNKSGQGFDGDGKVGGEVEG